ncbi:hypothetical protein V6N11_033876 [Hibiscus sabdariffa]|uniref:Uncharacterized protein n=1 Tax=Hibiscus sabdariffa TaxID=183260 RepID=A0ABR2S183_9ROSI
MDSDLEMARHVVYVHQNKESPTLGFTPLEPSVLATYIDYLKLLIFLRLGKGKGEGYGMSGSEMYRRRQGFVSLNLGVGNSPWFTVPHGLSPSGLLNSPAFFCLSPQSPFGISHQQALAQVTTQVALVHRTLIHPSINAEETSQHMPTLAFDPQSSTMEYSKASQFDKKKFANKPSPMY